EPAGREFAARTRNTGYSFDPAGIAVVSGDCAMLARVTTLLSPADHTAVPAVFAGSVIVPKTFKDCPALTTPLVAAPRVALTSGDWSGITVNVTEEIEVLLP